ncbi:MAG: Ig-like domain repeat protein, partial [Sulfolobus sp.]
MRKALTIFIIILILPSLLSGIGNLVVMAQGGGGGSNNLGHFISTLQTLIPAALMLLAILANRYDQRYALVLFAAAMASAIFLAAAGQTTLSFYSPGSTEYISLSISGPTTVYVGQTGTWTINASASWY